MDLHIAGTYLQGKNILKVKRDYNDPYLWVLAQNNEVYRINSLTKSIDDYTAKFSAYHTSFIDIAGTGQDWVFIATNSSDLIEYHSGSIKVTGAANGLSGIINSIGVTNTGQPDYDFLIIATNSGFFYYNFKTDNSVVQKTFAPDARVLEMSYRTEALYNYLPCQCSFIQGHNIISLFPLQSYSGQIYLGGNQLGNNLKAAFITPGDVFSPQGNFGYSGRQFWATENGLFENLFKSSDPQNFKQFLKGVDITKISSVYGLLAISINDMGLIKENLLIGSTQGLYFSNSQYAKGVPEVRPYSFFHYDDLGNKQINDICVDADSYNGTQPFATINASCEDGIWVAAVDGLYFIQPDYSPYMAPATTLNCIQFDNQDNTVTNAQVCTDLGIKAVLQTSYQNHNLSLQWYKNGQILTGEINSSLQITTAGKYNAVVYDPCSGFHLTSNLLTVTTSEAPVFSFNYPDKLSYCYNSWPTLSVDNNSDYQYRWYKDGVLNGYTAPSFTITQPGKYKLEVSSCPGSWVSTKEVQIDFVKVPQPTIIPDKNGYCTGNTATLTANIDLNTTGVIDWQPYQYRWFKNGDEITGESLATIKTTSPGYYKVMATSCTGNSAISADYFLDFIDVKIPVISPDKSVYCDNDVATLSSDIPNDGTFNIQWYYNGLAMQNSTTPDIHTQNAGAYSVTATNKLSGCSQTSAPYNLSFTQPPTLSLQRIINTTLCDGETVDLKATYLGGTIKWSTGETADQIKVNQSATYIATVSTQAGCSVSQNMDVQFFPKPTLNVPDATLCQFTNQTITLTAPAGFAKYEWNGQQGNSTFVTGAIGKVTLNVTDNNGCTALQTINISSHCDDIHIPNAFTPNGDGINDKWEIAGLQGDHSTTVKVFNRYGTLVLQSVGYAAPWDGTFDGKKLPSGVYYYVINARGSKQVVSGSVSIIY